MQAVGFARGITPYPVPRDVDALQARVFFTMVAFQQADWEQRTGFMRRFTSNRWWILILAFVLSVAGVASMHAVGLAATGTDGTIGSTPIDGTGTPDPAGTGDPDSPSGSGKSSLQSGGDVFYGTTSTSGAGDVAVKTVTPAWVMRVRFALGLLKTYYLRY